MRFLIHVLDSCHRVICEHRAERDLKGKLAQLSDRLLLEQTELLQMSSAMSRLQSDRKKNNYMFSVMVKKDPILTVRLHYLCNVYLILSIV